MLNFVGRTPCKSRGSSGIVPLCLRGSKIFFRGYFMGLKFFLVGISLVPNLFSLVFHGSLIYSRGYFVSQMLSRGFKIFSCSFQQF